MHMDRRTIKSKFTAIGFLWPDKRGHEMTKFLPVAMAVESVVAGALCLSIGDWRRGLYWILCAAIAIVVTF